MNLDTGVIVFLFGVICILIFSVMAIAEGWHYEYSTSEDKVIALLCSFISLVCVCVIPSAAMYATLLIEISKINELFIAIFLAFVLFGIWSWATGMKTRFPKVIYVSFIVIYIVLTFIGTIWERNYLKSSFDEVPYWYWAKSNEGKFKTCPAKDARIVFIDEDEEPRVVITIEHELKVKIDHNTEGVEVDEEVVEDKTKKIYHFHLHKSTTKHHLW